MNMMTHAHTPVTEAAGTRIELFASGTDAPCVVLGGADVLDLDEARELIAGLSLAVQLANGRRNP